MSAISTCTTLLKNQPSVVATSKRTAESTSPTKRGPGGVKPSGSCKKLGVKRGSNALKKLGKTGCQSKVVYFPMKIKIRIPVLSAKNSTDGEPTGASFTHEIPDVEVDDDDGLTIPSSSSSDKNGFSNT